MPEPIIDPPDRPDPPPASPSSVFDVGDDAVPFPGTQASVMQLPPAGRSTQHSMDDLTKYDSVLEADKDITRRQIGAEAGATQAMERRDAEYSSRMNRLIAAEGATMDDIKPWQPDQESAKYKTDLWAQFGSPGFVISMIASAFTAMPMNSALNAGAAAMNAINEGDFENYHRAYDAWKENTRLTLKRIDLENKEFDQLDTLRKSDMASWAARMRMTLARFNDERKLALLNAGLDDQLMESLSAQTKLREQLSDASINIEKNNARMQIFRAKLGDSKDPRKIAEAATYADTVFTDAKTPEQIAMRNLVLSDDYQNAKSEDQTKMVMNTLKDISEARYGSRGAQTPLYQEVKRRNDAWDAQHPDAGDEERNAAYDKNMRDVMTASKPVEDFKAKATAAHQQTMEDIAKGKLTVEQAKAQEDARHKQAMDDIAAGRLKNQTTAEEEKERHDKAIEEISKSKTTQVTANKAAELGIMSQRYTSAVDLIDKIVNTVHKYTGAVGAAGYARRSAESLSNLLGSNKSDLRQIESWLAELQMMAPRLITESAGRPLAAEAEKTAAVVRGKNFGDTKVNTLRDLLDLKEQFTKVKAGLDKIRTGSDAAPEKTEDKPAANWDSFPDAQ